MKKVLLSMVMCLCALCGVQAQTIQNGSNWFDGSVLYTAKVQGNAVTMEGIGEHEGGFRFHLTKVEGKNGEYILTGSEEEAASLRAKVGWRVQYVRQDGMYFLAVRKPNGDAVWKMTLTPDNLENSLAFERYLEKQPVSDQLSPCLLWDVSLRMSCASCVMRSWRDMAGSSSRRICKSIFPNSRGISLATITVPSNSTLSNS